MSVHFSGLLTISQDEEEDTGWQSVALPSVPDLDSLLSLDFLLQLQDAIEQGLGGRWAAWGRDLASVSAHGERAHSSGSARSP